MACSRPRFASDLFAHALTSLARISRPLALSLRWNCLEAINILIFIFVLVGSIFTEGLSSSIANRFFSDGGTKHCAPCAEIASFVNQVNNVLALNVIIAYLKLFKFLRFSPRMAVLLQTMSSAFDGLIAFVIMLGILFYGYSLAFYAAFSNDIFGFSTLALSGQTLFSAMLGDFNYEEMRRTNRVLAPILFFTFSFIIVMILLNIFIAIIVESYTELRKSVDSYQDDSILQDIRKMVRMAKRCVGLDQDSVRQVEDENEMDKNGLLGGDASSPKKKPDEGGRMQHRRSSLQSRKEEKLKMASLAPKASPAATRSSGTTSNQDIAEMLHMMRSMSKEMKEMSDQVWTVSDDMKKMKNEMTKVQQTLNEP